MTNIDRRGFFKGTASLLAALPFLPTLIKEEKKPVDAVRFISGISVNEVDSVVTLTFHKFDSKLRIVNDDDFWVEIIMPEMEYMNNNGLIRN